MLHGDRDGRPRRDGRLGANRYSVWRHYCRYRRDRESGELIAEVLDEDLDNGFARIAEQYNMTVPEAKGYFKSRDDMLPFINELLNEKILKFLSEESQFTEIEAGQEKQAAVAEEVEAEDNSENQEKSGE